MTSESLGRRFAEDNGVTVASFADFYYLRNLPPDLFALGDYIYPDERAAYVSLGNAVTVEA